MLDPHACRDAHLGHLSAFGGGETMQYRAMSINIVQAGAC
jgi:hypothetical protein